MRLCIVVPFVFIIFAFAGWSIVKLCWGATSWGISQRHTANSQESLSTWLLYLLLAIVSMPRKKHIWTACGSPQTFHCDYSGSFSNPWTYPRTDCLYWAYLHILRLGMWRDMAGRNRDCAWQLSIFYGGILSCRFSIANACSKCPSILLSKIYILYQSHLWTLLQDYLWYRWVPLRITVWDSV